MAGMLSIRDVVQRVCNEQQVSSMVWALPFSPPLLSFFFPRAAGDVHGFKRPPLRAFPLPFPFSFFSSAPYSRRTST